MEPPDPQERDNLVHLAMVEGVGPRLGRALMEQFGSAGAVLDASATMLRGVDGVGAKLAERIVRARDEIDLVGEQQLMAERQVRVLTCQDPDFPSWLRNIFSPPLVLYCRGTLVPTDALALAIVGSRRCTHYGRQQAERFGGALARVGFTVVSGLARGIDACAHRGALQAGGRTLAVLGNGLASIYPPEHADLAEQVVQNGALVSELPMRTTSSAGVFPQRNRLISGLSLGVLVVEAAARSGALITARHAGEQGREVFALPGRIDQLASQGTNRLIQDGAKLVTSVDDVIDELGPLAEHVPRDEGPPVRDPVELTLNAAEAKVLAALDGGPVHVDEIVARTDLTTSQATSTLLVLEMRRLVTKLPGGLYDRRHAAQG